MLAELQQCVAPKRTPVILLSLAQQSSGCPHGFNRASKQGSRDTPNTATAIIAATPTSVIATRIRRHSLTPESKTDYQEQQERQRQP